MAPRNEESTSPVISQDPAAQLNNSTENEDCYPFTWTDLSDEEKKERKRIYTNQLQSVRRNN